MEPENIPTPDAQLAELRKLVTTRLSENLSMARDLERQITDLNQRLAANMAARRELEIMQARMQ